MVTKDHPVWQTRSQLLVRYPEVTLEFSKYVYREYGITESREIFQVSAGEASETWVTSQIETLTSEQELALHSRVIYRGKTLHIPMVDFANTKSVEDIWPRMGNINELLNEDIWIYNSGHSFHGYYFCLLDESCWYRFLGNSLLLNSRQGFSKEVIDSRWIGHSLEHGFSALRWSKNTNRHHSMPFLVGHGTHLKHEDPDFTFANL